MELKEQARINYTNKNKNNSSDNYYYSNISNNKSGESIYNNYHPNNNNMNIKTPTINNEYHLNNNIHNNISRDRYSTNQPYMSPHHSTYLHNIPSYSNRMEQQPSISLPPPNSLLPPEKGEFKNVYVKIKSKRINDRYDNDTVFDLEHMKYSKEEIKQLKKELNIEFNGVDTLEEFKKLNQNEQKKLIIQICRFLMRRAGIKSENSIPWKKLAVNNAAFTFINWPLVLPSKPIEPGYPTRFESYFENVPYEDLSLLKTSHRKTLFMALRSGAVYAVKLQKRKKTDVLKSNNINTMMKPNLRDMPSLRYNDGFSNSENTYDGMDQRKRFMEKESFIPINRNNINRTNDSLNGEKINEDDPPYSFRSSNNYDYKDKDNFNRDYYYKDGKEYNRNNDEYLNIRKPYPDDWKYRQNNDNKELENYWRNDSQNINNYQDRKENDWKYYSRDNNYRDQKDDYWKYNNYDNYDIRGPPPNMQDYNRRLMNNSNDDHRPYYSQAEENDRNYYKQTVVPRSQMIPPEIRNKKRSFESIYSPDNYSHYDSLNNHTKSIKSTHNPYNLEPIQPPYDMDSRYPSKNNNHRFSSNPSLNSNSMSSTTLSNYQSNIGSRNDKQDTYFKPNSFYDTPYNSNDSRSNQSKYNYHTNSSANIPNRNSNNNNNNDNGNSNTIDNNNSNNNNNSTNSNNADNNNNINSGNSNNNNNDNNNNNNSNNNNVNNDNNDNSRNNDNSNLNFYSNSRDPYFNNDSLYYSKDRNKKDESNYDKMNSNTIFTSNTLPQPSSNTYHDDKPIISPISGRNDDNEKNNYSNSSLSRSNSSYVSGDSGIEVNIRKENHSPSHKIKISNLIIK